MLEMSVNSIRVGPGNGRLVMLKEKDSDRYLPILMSDATAYAIATKLKDLSITRPSTHDLLHTVIDTLGGQVKTHPGQRPPGRHLLLQNRHPEQRRRQGN